MLTGPKNTNRFILGPALSGDTTRIEAAAGASASESPTADGAPPDSASPLVELQETLYASRNPTRRWLHQSRRAWIESVLERLAAERPSGDALEVGPGSGVYLPSLCRLFGQVTAIDVEDAFLDRARAGAAELPNLTLVADDVLSPSLPAESFDLILCSEVIEHIDDPAGALGSLRRLLRPGGVLVLSTPQSLSPLELIGRVAFYPGAIAIVRRVYREPVLPTGHISLLTARRARRLIERAGLRVVAHDRGGLYLPLVAEFGGEPGKRLLQRLEGRLCGHRLRGLLWTQYWIAERPPA